jgi:hypothetical protein
MKTIELNRRQFLKTTGGLIVSFNLFPSLRAFGQSTVAQSVEQRHVGLCIDALILAVYAEGVLGHESAPFRQ